MSPDRVQKGHFLIVAGTFLKTLMRIMYNRSVRQAAGRSPGAIYVSRPFSGRSVVRKI